MCRRSSQLATCGWYSRTSPPDGVEYARGQPPSIGPGVAGVLDVAAVFVGVAGDVGGFDGFAGAACGLFAITGPGSSNELAVIAASSDLTRELRRICESPNAGRQGPTYLLDEHTSCRPFSARPCEKPSRNHRLVADREICAH
jgi:hypothetical protein